MLDGLLVAPAHPAVPEGDEHPPDEALEELTEEEIIDLGLMMIVEDRISWGDIRPGRSWAEIRADLGLPPRGEEQATADAPTDVGGSPDDGPGAHVAPDDTLDFDCPRRDHGEASHGPNGRGRAGPRGAPWGQVAGRTGRREGVAAQAARRLKRSKHRQEGARPDTTKW